MAGGKKGGDMSKKAQGQARKADAASQKAAAEDAQREATESAEWTKGSKSNAKKEAEAAKKAEQARKKSEREALLAEEERSLPGRAAPKNAKSAGKKTSAAAAVTAPSRKLDLSQLDGDDSSLAAVNASGIDNALDALSLDHDAASGAGAIDRHPERRFKAAYAAFEERRLEEMDNDGSGKGLRLNQRKERLRKEFEKSPENPFNQVTGRFDSTREELAQIHAQEKGKIERRLGA
ncbi:duf1014 domain containing protein [Grosmannia clavigera kw1407]|uniref:Duf1014 domain containing protein n=1 Tax=Grosmannia clavigera (strain kw1407 / UAMH 11150) TaxID=655863 RepID=F0XUT2_GROCL|nr:duf1014 domain containing protein [Grosmannia clavigera kw1407]EFW99028.1 duf1014 domain containing protein [Grosmannia clavigera kw1407]